MWCRVDSGQGFSALLEPFYGGKSLTDPISTAEVGNKFVSTLLMKSLTLR